MGAAARGSLGGDTASVPTGSAARLPVAPVVDAGPCHPRALIVTVVCPYCAGRHRHAVEPGARHELGRLDREALCDERRSYVIDLGRWSS